MRKAILHPQLVNCNQDVTVQIDISQKRRLDFSSLQKVCINNFCSESSQAYPQTWHPAPSSALGSPWGAFQHEGAFCFHTAAAGGHPYCRRCTPDRSDSAPGRTWQGTYSPDRSPASRQYPPALPGSPAQSLRYLLLYRTPASAHLPARSGGRCRTG